MATLSVAIFFIGTTLLHELMHWGENDNENFTYDGEEGWLFEQEVYDIAIEVGTNGSLTIHSLPFNCN